MIMPRINKDLIFLITDHLLAEEGFHRTADWSMYSNQ
jgi:hypothetical protein